MSDNSVPPRRLNEDAFEAIIRNAPLVSIDLIVRDKQGCFLVGHRKNEPARDKFFVLGGRIYKDERLDDAFRRITKKELKAGIERKNALFIGVFEHHYQTNYFGRCGFGTHYVVLAYEIVVDQRPEPDFDQHDRYEWWTGDEILLSDECHENTKAYFRQQVMRSEKQYSVLANRRNATNTMLWQTPALCLTAISFLLTVAGNTNSHKEVRMAACGLALFISLFTLQLFARHRFLEKIDAELLEGFEARQRHMGYAKVHAKPPTEECLCKWLITPSVWSSYWWWVVLFIVFAGASGYLLVYNFEDCWADKSTPANLIIPVSASPVTPSNAAPAGATSHSSNPSNSILTIAGQLSSANKNSDQLVPINQPDSGPSTNPPAPPPVSGTNVETQSQRILSHRGVALIVPQ